MTAAHYRARAIIAIKRERIRQIEAEGWTPKHDDGHGADAALRRAGDCYLKSSRGLVADGEVPAAWPWDAKWWKPRTIERDLVRAGALFDAEVDRLDRLNIAVDFDYAAAADRREVIGELARIYQARAELAA